VKNLGFSFQIFLASLFLRRSLSLFFIFYSPFPILNLREHIGFHRNLWTTKCAKHGGCS